MRAQSRGGWNVQMETDAGSDWRTHSRDSRRGRKTMVSWYRLQHQQASSHGGAPSDDHYREADVVP